MSASSVGSEHTIFTSTQGFEEGPIPFAAEGTEDLPTAPPPTPVNPALAAQLSEDARAGITGLLQEADSFIESGTLDVDVASIATDDVDDFLEGYQSDVSYGSEYYTHIAYDTAFIQTLAAMTAAPGPGNPLLAGKPALPVPVRSATLTYMSGETRECGLLPSEDAASIRSDMRTTTAQKLARGVLKTLKLDDQYSLLGDDPESRFNALKRALFNAFRDAYPSVDKKNLSTNCST
jgi:hypothetical protein